MHLRPRLDLAALAIVFFANGLNWGSVVSRSADIRARAGIDNSQLGLVFLAVGLGGVIASPLAGRVVDAARPRRSVATSLAGIGVGSLILAFSESIAGIAVAFLLMGVLDTSCDVGMNSHAAVVQARRPAMIMNRLHGMWSLGLLLGGIGGAFAASRTGDVTAHLCVNAVAVAAAGFAAWFGLDEFGHLEPRRGPSPVDHPALGPVDALSEPTERTRSSAQGSPRSRSSVLLGALGAAGALCCLLEVPPGDWASVTLVDEFGGSSSVGSIAFAAYSAGMLVGRAAGDRLADTIGRLLTARVAIGLIVCGIGALALAPSTSWALAAFGMIGVGSAPVFPLLYLAAAEATSSSSGLAAVNLGMRGALLFADPLVGRLADAMAPSRSLLWVSGTAGVLLLVVSSVGARSVLGRSSGPAEAVG